MATTLQASPDDVAGRVALLVNAYAGSPAAAQPGGAQLELRCGSSQPVVELVPVCQQLARLSSKAGQLLGADPAQEAQVLEWLTWAAAGGLAGHVSDSHLEQLSAHLGSRTFLAGNALSLADLVVFALVHAAVAKLPQAQYDSCCSLLRWTDLLQHTTAGTSSSGAAGQPLFAPLGLQLPPFVPPPPPPAPSAKPSAAAAASTSSGASQASTATGAPAAGGKKGKAAAAAAAGAAAAGAATAAAAATSKQQPAAAAAAGEAGGQPAKAGKEGGKAKKEKAAPAPKAEAEEPRIDMLDIRVGVIVSVKQHPNADSLYLEEIDVGEDKPRLVISGLVKFVPREQMENRRVVVCCNLKPAKMRDVMSFGMVLCASSADHTAVDPITPPEGVPPGERITFEGYTSPPLEEINPKRKILERLFPDLTTGPDATPCYKGVPFMTTKGPVTATIPNAHVA